MKAIPGALMLLLSSCATNATEWIEGVAVRLDNGVEVYRERHRIEGTTHRIDYRGPGGERIAQVFLDYACSDSAPDHVQHDLRSGERIGGRWELGRYVLQHNGKRREMSDSYQIPSSATVTNSLPLVASSGFDRFLRSRWNALVAGESMSLAFAMPARLDQFTLRVRRIEEPRPELAVAAWFVIEPAAALLRAFVDPILVGYGAEHRLQLYRGLSNLADTDGSPLDVEIRYAYSPSFEDDEKPDPIAALERTTVNSECREDKS